MKKMSIITVFLLVMLTLSSQVQSSSVEPAKGKELGKGLYAIIKTSKGDITCKLYEEESPLLVENIVGLANGTKEYTDPKENKLVKGKFYDGLTFHRVIPNFMIQFGCPLGNGRGGPGYRVKDEFHPSLKHDKPGMLSMANSGPNTNGSQLFITVVPTPWLDNRHSIIGQVVEGMDVVNAIAVVPRDAHDMPKEPVTIKTIEIKKVDAD